MKQRKTIQASDNLYLIMYVLTFPMWQRQHCLQTLPPILIYLENKSSYDFALLFVMRKFFYSGYLDQTEISFTVHRMQISKNDKCDFATEH